MNCKDCRHFTKYNEFEFECRAVPPVPIHAGYGVYESRFPIVNEYDWCGFGSYKEKLL